MNRNATKLAIQVKVDELSMLNNSVASKLIENGMPSVRFNLSAEIRKPINSVNPKFVIDNTGSENDLPF